MPKNSSILRFDEDDLLFARATLLDHFCVVVGVASRAGVLRRPQEQIDAAVTRAVWTL